MQIKIEVRNGRHVLISGDQEVKIKPEKKFRILARPSTWTKLQQDLSAHRLPLNAVVTYYHFCNVGEQFMHDEGDGDRGYSKRMLEGFTLETL
jgi:hypothetical protein